MKRNKLHFLRFFNNTILLKSLPAVIVALLGLTLTVFAWSEPSAVPPGSNVSAPLNIGSASQYKSGALGVGGAFHGYSNGIFDGFVGIGIASPAMNIGFGNLNDGRNAADGITWYNPSPTSYGIFRSAGPWSGPNYQQLTLSWSTGIVLNPGTAYGKSYVDVQGNGLRTNTLCLSGDCRTVWPAANSGDITGVYAGSGLSGGGSSGEVTLSANYGAVQARVNGSCPSGQSIRSIDSNGNVACENDDVGIGSESDPVWSSWKNNDRTLGGSLVVNSGYVYAYNNAYPIRLGELWGHAGLLNGSGGQHMYFGTDQAFYFLNRSGGWGPTVNAQDFYSNAAGRSLSTLSSWMNQGVRTDNAPSFSGITSNGNITVNSGYVYAFNNAYPIRLGELWGHTGLYNGSSGQIMYFASDQYFNFLNRSGNYGPTVYAQDFYSNAAGRSLSTLSSWLNQSVRTDAAPTFAGVNTNTSSGIVFGSNFRAASGPWNDSWLRILNTGNDSYAGGFRTGGLAGSNLYASNDIYLGTKGRWLSDFVPSSGTAVTRCRACIYVSNVGNGTTDTQCTGWTGPGDAGSWSGNTGPATGYGADTNSIYIECD